MKNTDLKFHAYFYEPQLLPILLHINEDAKRDIKRRNGFNIYEDKINPSTIEHKTFINQVAYITNETSTTNYSLKNY